MLCGNLLNRSPVEFSHRCQCAWTKFHCNHDVLVDKNISVKSRLKFFQSVISPTILFGLSQVAFTRLQLQKLDSIFRRMLRSIVGWVRLESDTWHETMSRMKVRVNRAPVVFPIEDWSTQVMRH